jgi:hypothetical protein
MHRKSSASIIFFILGLIILGVWGYFIFQKITAPEEILLSPFIEITSPKSNEPVSSPLRIKGITKSGWVVFEAQAGTATLYDGNGVKIGFALLKAVGEWMKPEVDFETTLTFEKPETGTGRLVFKDDNPQDESLAKYYTMSVSFPSGN